MSVIKRLPRYYRFLGNLKKNGVVRISSKELSSKMGFTASQIRQDLNCFGGFGQQGYGYNVTYLYGKISEILGVHENYQAIIVGAGRLGQALASSPVFTKRGVEVCALFDTNPDIIGKQIDGRPVMHIDDMKDFVDNNVVDIAVLTLPYEFAESAVDMVKTTGIKGIWNFTSHDMDHIPGVTVQNVHMGDSLMMLCYDIKHKDENDEV